jgi:hypothetical protein
MLEPIAIALVLAAITAAIWRAAGSKGWPILALAWVAYAGYESLIVLRILCTGECNIRVDLLLLYPVLLGSTVWAGVALAIRRWRQRRGG